MADFNEARFPLTKDKVTTWARSYFPVQFRALPKAPASKWIEFNADSFIISRSVWRSLDRSVHKKLLIIGGYAPGPAIIDDEPTDPVLAHVHAEEAEVSFYRIAESSDGEQELEGFNSTSAVAFHPPFCDVGEDTGSSKAIHRVSALILYYFLAAGHVNELPRNKSDPTMFTRNFRDACSWIENGGERPIAPPTTRRSSIAATASPDNIVVRPKRTSTISSNTRSSTEAVQPPAKVKRSATDDLGTEHKKYDETRPRKHPRRTLSEQIHIPSLQSRESVLSPRSPAPERVHQALSDRIQHLKDENAGLKGKNEELHRQAEGYQSACEQLKKLEADMDALKRRVDRAEEDAAAAKQDATTARDDAATTKAELATIRNGLTTKLRKTARK